MKGFYIKKTGFPTTDEIMDKVKSLSERWGKPVKIYTTAEAVTAVFNI